MNRIAIASLAAVALIGCSKAPNVRGFADVPAPQTYYVSSSTGLDTNAGTQDKPLKSLAVAVKRMGPGDTLSLKAGDTWAECVTVPYDGETFNAYGSGAKPTLGAGCVHAVTAIGRTGITLDGLHLTGTVQEAAFFDKSGDNGKFNNLTVDKYGYSGLMVRSAGATPVAGWKITNNNIGLSTDKPGLNYNRAGIQLKGLKGALVQNNIVATGTLMGIQDRPNGNWKTPDDLKALCADNIITKNRVLNNEGNITGVCYSDEISRNYIHDSRGFAIQPGPYGDVYNNIIAHIRTSTDKTLYNSHDGNGAPYTKYTNENIWDVDGCAFTMEGGAVGVKVSGGIVDVTIGGGCAVYVTANSMTPQFDGKTVWRTQPNAKAFKMGSLAYANMKTQAQFTAMTGAK